MAEARVGKRRVLTGTVISNAMDKTVVVEVASVKAHPVYKKRYHTTKKYYVHDEENQCGIGDRITIAETRPLSKTKRWRVLDIVERAR
ncbi:MAG: 30S ribosomal protein S17 [Candidatus Fermentibacteraceae bacterium]|nr:30S ribosomal protein S17 [Candidatus Fermentibacteraceae bacterium]MBN2609770.1 30S ribosomal protein S17 [Candidatus Fermentibacteraceae bacterium]